MSDEHFGNLDVITHLPCFSFLGGKSSFEIIIIFYSYASLLLQTQITGNDLS